MLFGVVVAKWYSRWQTHEYRIKRALKEENVIFSAHNTFLIPFRTKTPVAKKVCSTMLERIRNYEPERLHDGIWENQNNRSKKYTTTTNVVSNPIVSVNWRSLRKYAVAIRTFALGFSLCVNFFTFTLSAHSLPNTPKKVNPVYLFE